MTISEKRCPWGDSDPLYRKYHDREWGVPLHNDRKLFEMLILEGMQAGLSWLIILRKRQNFRKAFDNFVIETVASYGRREVEKLLKDEGIVRNRLKLEAAVENARKVLEIRKEFGTFDYYLWRFVGGKPKINRWKSLKEVPPSTAESDAMSKDLKARGFRFVGSTVCYAFMQATGMVNDHLIDCFRHRELSE